MVCKDEKEIKDNLECCDRSLVGVGPRLDRPVRVLAAKLGESGSLLRVDNAVAHPIPPVLLPFSHHHDDPSIDVMCSGVEGLTMDLPRRRGVPTEAIVGGGVAVRFGAILRVVHDVGRCLALVRACKGLQGGDWCAMCLFLSHTNKGR